MTKLAEMFKTPEDFIAYAEATSGMNYDDEKVKEWFYNNQDFPLTYTGVQRELNKMLVKDSETK